MLHCSSLVARLPVCLASGDTDIVHWSVVLLHDLVLSEGQCYIGTHSLYNFLIFDFFKFFFFLVICGLVTSFINNESITISLNVIGTLAALFFTNYSVQL